MARRRTRSRTGRLPARAAEPEQDLAPEEEERAPRGSGRGPRAGGGSMAAGGSVEKKKKKGQMIWGLILIVVGAITLAAVWDIAKSVFEAKGPIELDLAAFEREPDVKIEKFLESTNKENGGYGRHVIVTNAECATFNTWLLEGNRKVSEVAYLTVAPGSGLHKRYDELAELVNAEAGTGDEDANKTNVQKIISEQLPKYGAFRLIVISPEKEPWEKRFNKVFWATAGDFGSERGIEGVIRPFSWLPDSDQAGIITAPGFKEIRNEEEDYLYVLLEGAVPPDEGTAYMCLVGPILFMLGGFALLILGMRDPVGAASRRKGGGGGGGSAGRASRGRSRGASQRGEAAGSSRRGAAKGSQRRDPSKGSQRRDPSKGSQRRQGGARKSSRGTGRVAKAPPQVD